ncbi:MAG TPA: hypothetical protein VGP08_26365 [Pyrinomonadaceae bacterium]|jgi:hypothetical protein|nr:hypothetical protein [Pyrinomonadaceae bacterium]
MPDENTLATLEKNLGEQCTTRSRLASRLADLEAEAERLRTQVNEVDGVISQMKAALFRIVSSNYSGRSASVGHPSDADIEEAISRDRASGMSRGMQPQVYAPAQRMPTPQHHRDGDDATRHHHIPQIRPDIEPKSDRFFERTISYAASVLLRESGGPLHVNEIYNRLLEGGFQFTGQNPTISIAVSLNRNNRFRKVAPGTFDLVMRDAAQQVS